MANKILAHVSQDCDHNHLGHRAEIYAERGSGAEEAEFYLTAMVTNDGETMGFGIAMEKQHLAAFAWSILRELEGLSSC